MEILAAIEYLDKIPHEVLTCSEEGYLSIYNFDARGGDKKDLIYYNSGQGGNLKNTNFDKERQVWVNPELIKKFGLSNQSNFIEKRIRLKNYTKSSIDPFKIATEVGRIENCETCGNFFDEDGCPEHHGLPHNNCGSMETEYKSEGEHYDIYFCRRCKEEFHD